MILRLAIRSLATRPVRTAVLACGFGFGIAVMAALLGVGAVILEQAHSPALAGGGDLVILGRFGRLESARFVIASVLGSPDLASRAVAVSPSKNASLYLLTGATPIEVDATGVIPSLERVLGGHEIAHLPQWVDAPADRVWSSPAPGDVLRAMDRFHPIPAIPEFSASWAEWLYFNGHTADGTLRFYLTFFVGPASVPGRRVAGVRLQLEREGKTATYSAGAEIDGARLLETAPDLDIAGNRVRLEGLRYRIELSLPGAAGELALDAAPGRSLPPATLRGARGWLSGYAAPVLSGTLRGTLTVGSDRIAFENAAGYHDHNWGFWKGVRWQWGQVAQGDLSVIYGRVFPPADVADPERVPGFLGVLGPQGPLGFSTAVSIEEQSAADGHPGRVLVHARGRSLDLRLTFAVDRSVRTAMPMMPLGSGPALDGLQLAGEYAVTGKVGDRSLDFTARGAAETFRPR